MRLVGLISAAVLTGAVLLASAGLANSAGQIHYAALGDSYASGVGTDSYDKETGRCRRGPFAYPALWAATHPVASFQFTACAEAKTTDLIADQVSVLTEATTLVTVQIGGNDAGFSDVMHSCFLSLDQACVDRVEQAKTYMTNTLPGELHRAYREVRTRAPNAQVVVLGYPRLYQVPATCFGGLSERKRTAMNEAADVLAEVIYARASAAGFSFLDLRGAFASHEICSSDPWLNGFSLRLGEAFHPNRAGHQLGYLTALSGFTG